ncbi:hypothetical protein [Parasedimentitalea psychrophila]|uniref:Zinc finger CHC2-type domain-containing protein n=1 Tax=Parasedimentitalea psychrophila TaxID=2997337 RepID=A0A9Y2L3Z0_9RHOB|nr:hypothetical protein [Parasedimentitalea psychrophila]WIY27535.1 hypothetical protein QPJ95_03320 [Parasedimentitalea psychrophila]
MPWCISFGAEYALKGAEQYRDRSTICLARQESLLAKWLPGGRLEGREWVALNPTRNDRRPGSFRINVDNGFWADFATPDKGGDPISLFAYLNGLSQKQAALELKRQLGMSA